MTLEIWYYNRLSNFSILCGFISNEYYHYKYFKLFFYHSFFFFPLKVYFWKKTLCSVIVTEFCVQSNGIYYAQICDKSCTMHSVQLYILNAYVWIRSESQHEINVFIKFSYISHVCHLKYFIWNSALHDCSPKYRHYAGLYMQSHALY